MRLLRWSIAGGTILVVALLLTFFRNTGHSFETPTSNRPAMRVRTPKTVRATPAMRHAAEATLGTFVRSAILRRNLASSWPLATPHMKIGTSHSDWLRGDLPVAPYAAAAFASAGWTLKYSYRNILGYDVLIVPKKNAAGTKAGQQVYSCELHDVHGRWLVDFCYVRKTL